MTLDDLRRTNGLLIDANLLVLLVVGTLDRDRIIRHKRTNKYTEEDFQLLLDFIDRFKRIVTTPNILTEVSNLVEGDSYQGVSALTILQQFALFADELTVSSIETMNSYQKSYLKFGLSDAVISSVANQNFLVLTEDLNFCAYLQGQGLLAINFNNLRTDYIFG